MAGESSQVGKIITFYSYKGGTGRSMALANMACWLSQRITDKNQRVLIMDWDLEAPGLNRYFAAKAELAENQTRPGVINYFDALFQKLKSDSALYEKISSDEGHIHLNQISPLNDYLILDVVDGVDFIKAGKMDRDGRMDDDCKELVNTFDWIDFFARFGKVIEVFRDLISSQYTYILVDSRTGVTDASGICTMLLPEKLVTVFTPNEQSISGILDIVSWAVKYRKSSEDFRPLSVFPLPSRIENAELKLKEEWRNRYQQGFEKTFREVYGLDECDLSSYFNDIQLPHWPYYSYGEKIALLEEQNVDNLSLRRAYETFFEHLLEFDVAWEQTDQPDLILDSEQLIYISYSHAENNSLEGERGWVELLHERLEIRLTQLLGERLKIWRDAKLSGNTEFGEQIQRTISKAAVFICVLTPRYLNSEYCQHELAEFQKQANRSGGVVIDGLSRIFKVGKTPVDWHEQPPALQSLLGYEFYERDGPAGRFREFSPGAGSDRDNRYWEKFDDLAQDLSHLLKKLRTKSKPQANTSPAPGNYFKGKTVYLAETTSDLSDKRDQLKRELALNGRRVLPDSPLLLSPNFHDDVNKYLFQSQVSVHLIGSNYGLILEGESKSIVEIQCELASDRCSDPTFSQIIWIPSSLGSSDGHQGRYIEQLLKNQNLPANTEILQTNLEDLKIFIHEKLLLSESQAELTAKNVSQPLSHKLVYLVCDQPDYEAVTPIEDQLYQLGFEILSSVGADPQMHKENLLTCDAILVYAGKSTDSWLQAKKMDLLKLAGYERQRPLLIKAFYLGAPQTTVKERFRIQDALVIRNYGKFSSATLNPFIEQVAKG